MSPSRIRSMDLSRPSPITKPLHHQSLRTKVKRQGFVPDRLELFCIKNGQGQDLDLCHSLRLQTSKLKWAFLLDI